MANVLPFTPGTCAIVTAGTSASSITCPTGAISYQLMIQVAAGANAALSFGSGTAEAPDGTPDGKAITFLGGTVAILTHTSPTISYIRVGGSDATVYLTWGAGD